jgi:hypothetical protein
LWGSLEEDDGIYNDQGKIRIRASAIITGALQIGGTPGEPDSKNVKFYAGLDNKIIKLGGWSVEDNKISIGSIGQPDSMWLVSSGDTDEASIAQSGNRTDWRIAIDSNFGITKQGHVYANKGVIGGIDVGEICSKAVAQEKADSAASGAKDYAKDYTDKQAGKILDELEKTDALLEEL